MTTLAERLKHFEDNQRSSGDEYGAEVLWRARRRIEKLEAEREQLRAVLQIVWRFFDSLYGASDGEPIPYLELPEDRQQLADEALDSVSEWLHGDANE